MSQHINKTAWLYHRGQWSVMKNLLYDVQVTHAADTTRRMAWRQILREYGRKWGNLGPTTPHADYSGILVRVYSYTGERKAPEYLIRIISIINDEVIYVNDLPDLLEILGLLAPLVSSGIFADAYMQVQNN